MRISWDSRFLALILLLSILGLFSILAIWGYGIYFIVFVLGLGCLLVFLRYPEIPMTVLFPLLWLFWSYNSPLIGGRLERVIGVLALAGMALVLLFNKRRTLLVIPRPVIAGLALLLGAYFISGVINSAPGLQEEIISLTMRLLFLYLACFHLQTSRQLRLASGLMIATGLAGAAYILFLNLRWGIGFFRTYQGFQLAQGLGPFWYSLLLGGNSLTVPAVLLLGIYPSLHRPLQRFLALAGSGFLFAMAFFSQFRREILITAVIVLIYLMVINFSGVRKGAIAVVIVLVAFYILVLQPSSIFQQRIAETAMVTEGTDPRLIGLNAGLQAFLQAPFTPIIGWGAGNYEKATFFVLGGGYPSWYYHAYNVFIYFAVEAGLLGLGGLLWTFLAVFRRVRQSDVGFESPESWILRSAPVLLLVIVVSFLFGNYYEMSLPWYLMGMMLAASRISDTSLLGGNK